jgi:hypothetical protein
MLLWEDIFATTFLLDFARFLLHELLILVKSVSIVRMTIFQPRIPFKPTENSFTWLNTGTALKYPESVASTFSL